MAGWPVRCSDWRGPRGFLALAWLLVVCCAPGTVHPAGTEIGGADRCVICHGVDMPLDAAGIFQTAHGAPADPRSPFGTRQCETCHGPGEEHAAAQSRGDPVAVPVIFGQTGASPVPEQNAACLNCHNEGSRVDWFASAHAAADVACASCHSIHTAGDRVRDPLAQQQACFDCHPQQRSAASRSSAHPLRFGAMACSSCHDPHQGGHDRLLIEPTVNDTCFTCHAEKRGPFLWEHAPASEDCSLCHAVHGSNHQGMLTRRAPLLCQQCHASFGHPSLSLSADDVDDPLSNRFLLARSCLNCHSQVHGSNHPSGATLHR